MTNEPRKPVDETARKNDELCLQLQAAEAEIADLQAANRQLRNELAALDDKLEDADNEIHRLGMVLKHREKNVTAAPLLANESAYMFAPPSTTARN